MWHIKHSEPLIIFTLIMFLFPFLEIPRIPIPRIPSLEKIRYYNNSYLTITNGYFERNTYNHVFDRIDVKITITCTVHTHANINFLNVTTVYAWTSKIALIDYFSVRQILITFVGIQLCICFRKQCTYFWLTIWFIHLFRIVKILNEMW